MKRDKDCMRDILLDLEAEDEVDGNGTSFDPFVLEERFRPKWNSKQLSYNMAQLLDAGFVQGKRDQTGGYYIVMISHQGHEFLDAVRDIAIWDQAKSGAKTSGTYALSLIWEVARSLVLAEVKAKLGL
ncbi:DUF2513 domain-containing protein [Lichenicoccus sp.]|uniref:DUF2513 domain-containing protein n=1 Tax=Lichenicoccus sp. TaxID=2781899 RepID=UPI003D14F44E